MNAFLLIDLVTAVAEINRFGGTKRSARLAADALAGYEIELAFSGLLYFGKQSFGSQKERRCSRNGSCNHKSSSSNAQMLFGHGPILPFYFSRFEVRAVWCRRFMAALHSPSYVFCSCERVGDCPEGSPRSKVQKISFSANCISRGVENPAVSVITPKFPWPDAEKPDA